MSDNANSEFEFEDISSSTSKKKTAVTNDEMGDFAQRAFSNMDKVLKVIAFIVAIGIFIVFTAIAAVVAYLDKSFILISIGIIAVGAVLALISLFFIYGIGQVISQNNEIIKHLR